MAELNPPPPVSTYDPWSLVRLSPMLLSSLSQVITA